jgi:hypothetical protein
MVRDLHLVASEWPKETQEIAAAQLPHGPALAQA